MKHVCTHKGIEFFVFRRNASEFAAMVAGVPTRGAHTVLEAEAQGRDAIDAGQPTKFLSQVSWPDSEPTSRIVDIGTATGAVRFAEFMWRTLAKGGSVSVEPIRD